MKTRWMVIAAVLGAALGVAAQDAPDKPQDVTLTAKASSMKEKMPHLTLNGTANFPEGTALKVSIERKYESVANSKLVETREGIGGGLVEVKGKKFQESPQIPGPSPYLIHITLAEEYLKPAIKDALKGKGHGKDWQFQVAGWGDDLVAQLGPKLLEIDAISRECVALAERVEKAAATESGWIKEKKNTGGPDPELVLTKEAEEVVKVTAKLILRMDRADLKPLFPAAYSELACSIQTMHGNAQHFSYEAGKFAGAKSYHSGAGMLKDHHNQPFSFENIKKYLAEAVPISGREFALWIVKDYRRTGCQIRADIQDALKTYGKRPGVDFISDRLAQATVADLDAFEKEIRGSLNEGKSDPKDKDKKPDAKPGEKSGDK